MKKILPILLLAISSSFYNCASIGKDNVSIHPTVKVDTQNILSRPTEYTIEIDTATWVEGTSYEGTELFGISFFENRFVSPTLLNKEGLDGYTLDAIRDAIDKGKSDAFHLVKAKDEVFNFPHKWFSIYETHKTMVKGHPIKYKFLGPVSEQKADEIYANGLGKGNVALDAKTPLFPAKEVKATPCCVK
jgi:hypothetical protein